MKLIKYYYKDIMITLFLIAGIVLAVYLAQQTHIFKSRAAGAPVSINGDPGINGTITVHSQDLNITVNP